jgi:uncharacterized protein YnzC (UPF0291/DUF896 family)
MILLQLGRQAQKQRREGKKRSLPKIPFYPNPGSQEKLFFELLGCDRGQQLEIDYKDGTTGISHAVIPRPYLNEPKYFLFRAGSRAGKSQAGAAYCHTMSQNYPSAIGLISANDYLQLRDSTITALINFCDRHNIPIKPRRETVEDTAASIVSIKGVWIDGVYHLVRTAKDFIGDTAKATQKGRGFEIGWAWLDEWFRVPSKTAWDALITRLSIPIEKPSILLTSTINTDNPYNWVYDLFDNPDRDEEKKKKYISLTGSTYENRHHLAKDYIEGLKASLTPELFSIEILGEYVPITEGKIFKYFNRVNQVLKLQPDFNHPIHLSLDFNHHPSCAIASQFIEGEVLILREWYLLNSNTFSLGENIANWLKDKSFPKYYLHGDATGNQKTANSLQTNWQIIRDKLKEFKPVTCFGKANPNVQDTINATNIALNQDKIFIDIQCRELTRDLESLRYNEKGEIDKKMDLMRSHLGDCLRYLIFDLLPYKKSSGWSTSSFYYG